jgi:hypothetical protein
MSACRFYSCKSAHNNLSLNPASPPTSCFTQRGLLGLQDPPILTSDEVLLHARHESTPHRGSTENILKKASPSLIPARTCIILSFLECMHKPCMHQRCSCSHVRIPHIWQFRANVFISLHICPTIYNI